MAATIAYTPGSGLRDLGTLGGTTSAPTGPNEAGQVVGSRTTVGGATHAFLWTPTDGMADITAVTGITNVGRLNDNLQTVNGYVAPSGPADLAMAGITPGATGLHCDQVRRRRSLASDCASVSIPA